MLVLTRKLNEEIHIGPNVTITILRVQGQAVRVGIQAPKHLNIVRGELIGRPKPSAAVVATSVAADDEHGCMSAANAIETPSAMPSSLAPSEDGTGEPEMTTGGRTLQRLSRCRASGESFDFSARHPQRSSPASHVALPASTPLGRRGSSVRQ